jgi:HlyD family secretion protein
MQDFELSEATLKGQTRRRYAGWFAAAIFVAVVGIGLWLWNPTAGGINGSDILTGTVRSGTFVIRLSAAGVLKPVEEKWATSLVGGTVETVSAEEGATVKPGQTLAQLSNPNLHAQEMQARSTLDSMLADAASSDVDLHSQLLTLDASLASAKSAAETAQLKAQIDYSLYQEHIIGRLRYRTDELTAQDDQSKVDFLDKKIALFQKDIPALHAAKAAEVEAARATLAEAQKNIAALQVKADMAGTVETLAVHAGQHIEAGSSVARIASVDKLKAVIQVTPNDASQIAVGQPAKVTFYGSVKETLTGLVERVSPAVVGGTVPVTIKLAGALPKGARPSLAVLGDVTVNAIPRTVYVERPVGAEPDQAGTVYRLAQDGHAALLTHVRFGAASSSEIQILSGLKPGDRIVTSDTSVFAGKPRVGIR